jgi:hypothetical protein
VKLTKGERVLIARRAAGEYAIIPSVERIVREHRKNRILDDQVFLEFARLATKKSYSQDEYDEKARAVLSIIPQPWGPGPKEMDQYPAETTPASSKKTRKKRIIKCGICAGEGHNARTCPNKPDTPTVKHTDGIERLSPGFDPNPPEVEEDT